MNSTQTRGQQRVLAWAARPPVPRTEIMAIWRLNTAVMDACPHW